MCPKFDIFTLEIALSRVKNTKVLEPEKLSFLNLIPKLVWVFDTYNRMVFEPSRDDQYY